MAKKTNKTSHVMDLLTNGASSEPNTPASNSPASPEAPSSQEKKGDVQSHTVTPKKVTVVDEGSRNDRLSSEILNKLSEELEQEQDQEGQEVSETMEMQTEQTEQIEQAENNELASEATESLAAEPEAVQDQTEISSNTLEDAVPSVSDVQPDLPEEPAENTAASPEKPPHQMIIPPSQINNHLQNREYHFVNVMERLIMRQDMNSFLEQYNVCQCERCVSDVYALALTGLPSKYVVTSQDSLSPILSYYESKYKIYMLTEIIKACNQVRESPRHKK